MIHRISASITLVCALVCALCAGCDKSASPSAPDPQPATLNPQPSTPALRLHWLGKKRLAAESNATNFMALWTLPESIKLEAQTLDKLATAPWRLWFTNAPYSTAPSAQLRSLLEDLVQEECSLEVLGGSNHASELVLAVRLSADRTAFWHTNLSAVLLSLFPGAQLSASGSDFRLQTSDFRLDLRRSGEWTIFSATPGTNQPVLSANLEQRFARTHSHDPSSATNYWFEFFVNASELNRAWKLGWDLPSNFPTIAVQAAGDGSNVRTWAKAIFPQAVPFTLKKWDIPTNLISDPLVSFTALRAADYWLGWLKPWDDSLLGTRPEQCFLWSLPGLQVRTYLAAPVPDANSRIQRLLATALVSGNAWLETNSIGQLVAAPQGGLGWQGVFSYPFVKAATDHGTPYIFAGMMPAATTNYPMSPAVIEAVLSRTNLVYYNWEMTNARMDAWTYMGQLFRVLSQKSQLPQNSAGLAWLKAISTNQTTAATVGTLDSTQEISIVRRSTMGLTAFELQLLADWLESPQFPLGLHTTLVPPEKRLTRHPSQNTNTPSR